MPGNAHTSRRRLFTVGAGASLVLGSVSLFGQSAVQFQSRAMVPGSSPAQRPLDEAGTNVVGAPYSAVGTRENVTKLLDGNRIVHKQVTRFYRDGQGRTRTEQQPFGMMRNVAAADIPAFVNVYDPVSGENYFLNAQNKTVQTFPSAPEGVEKPPSITPPVPAPPPQMHLTMGHSIMSFGGGGGFGQVDDPKPLGEKTIRGIKTVGARVKHTLAAGSVGNERPITVTVDQWFSPQLGVVIESSSRSSTGHESLYRLQQIELGEPDATLFQIPADYQREERTRGFQIMRSTKTPDDKPGQNAVQEASGTFRLTPKQ